MKIPNENEAIKRINRLKKRYKDYENPIQEIKEQFMAITSGYTEKDFNLLLKGKPKKEYLQKNKECYFCGNIEIIEHHVNYKPEVILYLCNSCHKKTHFLIEEYHKEIKKMQKR